MLITVSAAALILISVLAGLAACQNPNDGKDLDGETQTLDTGPTTSGYSGGSPAPNVTPYFSIEGGYTGPALSPA